MAQILSSHVRNWDKYYGSAANVECACNDCLTRKCEKPRIVVELWVPGCCERCNKKLADAISFRDGFERLDFDGKKLTVIGSLEAEDVLQACKKVKKSVKLWPRESGAFHPRRDKEPCTIL